MASTPSLLLFIGIALFLLSLNAAITLGVVSSMVAFLHSRYGRGPYLVGYPAGSVFLLSGLPANLVTDQGHTTNAAAGTALVPVGFGGVVALWLEMRSREKRDVSSPAFRLWALIVLLSWLLTMAALIYTFVETSLTDNQFIDLAVAVDNAAPARYPALRWTPENWYAAVLDLPLVSDDVRRVVSGNVTIMRAWRGALISLFILGFVLLVLVAVEVFKMRRRELQRVTMVEVLSPSPQK